MAKMKKSFVLFVEKTVPPAAMAVLAVSSLAQPVKTSLLENGLSSAVLLQCAPCLISAAACAALHALKRNPLLSIFCATALYMLLVRLF